jgi:hypothetical protein
LFLPQRSDSPVAIFAGEIFPFTCRSLAQLLFQGVQFADPSQGDLGTRRIGATAVKELSARMGPTADFSDFALRVQEDTVIAAESVGLQVAAESLQEFGRAVPFAARCVIEDRERMALVADVSPEAARVLELFVGIWPR